MLEVVVHTVDVADGRGVPALIQKAAETFPTLQKLWAGGIRWIEAIGGDILPATYARDSSERMDS